MNNTYIYKIIIIFILSIVFLDRSSFAQEFRHNIDHPSIVKIDGTQVSLLNISSNNTLLLQNEHEDFSLRLSTPQWQAKMKYKSVRNYIKLGVDNGITDIIANYKYRFHFQIKGQALPTNQISTPTSFFIDLEYNKDAGIAYNDLETFFLSTNFLKLQLHLIKVEDLNQPINNNTGYVPVPFNNIPKNVLIESGILAQRYDKNVIANHSFFINGRVDQNKNILSVSWDYSGKTYSNKCTDFPGTTASITPIKYELEWLYIDNYGNTINSQKYNKDNFTINYSFINNASRIQTYNTSFDIPLIYEKGILIYRVRTVRTDSVRYKNIEYGAWSLPDFGELRNTSVTFSSTKFPYCISNVMHFIDQSHMVDKMNWQHTVSFAEDGKYKNVVNYFDGLGNNRQTLTHLNSDPNYIIGVENVMDYEGRKAINSLPIPFMGQKLEYKNDLFLSARTNKNYHASDFDEGCFNSALPKVHQNSLANQYYSSLNPDQNGMQKFVPDAKGYPFVETYYSPDLTNKVLWQGGAGEEFQRFNNKGTKNTYVFSSQNELNKFKGSESGNSEFYAKVYSRDPNGQNSFTILDKAGKTIISGLAGQAPNSDSIGIEALGNMPSNPSRSKNDLLFGKTQSVYQGMKVYDYSLMPEAPSLDSIKYIAEIKPFSVLCNTNKYISIPASYEISLFDECFNTIDFWSGNAGNLNTKLTNNQSYLLQSGFETFNTSIQKYILNKKLIFKDNDLFSAAKQFTLENQAKDSCYDNEAYFIKQSILNNADLPCAPTTLLSQCDELLAQMKRDLTPGGLYAKYDNNYNGDGHSIFDIKYKKLYKFRIEYCTYDYKLEHIGSNPNVTPVCTATTYKEEWAENESMLTYNNINTSLITNTSIVDSTDNPNNPIRTKYLYEVETCVYDYLGTNTGQPNNGPIVTPQCTLSTKVNVWLYDENDINAINYPNLLNHILKDSVIETSGNNNPLGDPYRRFQSECLNSLPFTYIYPQNTPGVIPNNLFGAANLVTPQRLVEIFNSQDLADKNLQDAILEGLLPLHPDYCKLLACAGEEFDERLRSINTFKEAQIYGFGNTNILNTIASTDPLNTVNNNQSVLTTLDLTNIQIRVFNSVQNTNTLISKSIHNHALELTYGATHDGIIGVQAIDTFYSDTINSVGYPSEEMYKDIYVRNLIQTYLSNKIRLTSGNECGPCNEIRIASNGPSIMPSVMNNGNISEDFDMPDWMAREFNNALNGGTSSNGVPNGLTDSLNAYNKAFIDGRIESLVRQFKGLNGLTPNQENSFRTLLSSFFENKKNDLSYTPQEIDSLLELVGFTLRNEFYNVYLVNYISNTFDNRNVYLAANSPKYYEDVAVVMNQVFSALKNNLSTISLPNNNLFASQIATKMGGNNLTISSVIKGSDTSSMYTEITFSNGTNILKYNLKPATVKNLRWNITNGAKSQSMYDIRNHTFNVHDVKSVLFNKNTISDYTSFIDRNMAYLNIHHSGAQRPISYIMWSKDIPMNKKRVDSDLDFAITCVDINNAITQFKSAQSQYKYSSVGGDPLFEKALTNYLNYHFTMQYTFEDYESLMEGCNLATYNPIKNVNHTYELTFSSANTAEAFQQNINNHFNDTINIRPLMLQKSGVFKVYLSRSNFPQGAHYALHNYISTNAGWTSQYNVEGDGVSLYAENNVCINPLINANIPGINYSSTPVTMKMGNVWTPIVKHHWTVNQSITRHDLLTFYTLYNNINNLENCPIYISNTERLAYFSHNPNSSHQAYLTIVNDLITQNASKEQAAYTLSWENLKTRPEFSSLNSFVDNDPIIGSNKTGLYFVKATNQANNQLLNNILNSVFSQSRNQLFDGTSRMIEVNGNTTYTNIKTFLTTNGGVGYVTFNNQTDELYEVFIHPLSKLHSDIQSYKIINNSFKLRASNTDSIQTFEIKGLKTISGINDTVTFIGYTNIVLGTSGKINTVVLGTAKGSDIDTFICEQDLIQQAIVQGKIAYRVYTDSIINDLYTQMKVHFPTQAIDTLWHHSATMQYHFTNYYYDLVGNLTRTVPPEGIRTTTATATQIDQARNTNILLGSGAINTQALGNKIDHAKVSSYQYNSLNQIVEQNTPDGGKTKFYYDKFGRLVFSQNNVQAENKSYAYTIYDDLSRVIESGTLLLENNENVEPSIIINSKTYADFKAFITSRIRRDIVATYYDSPLINLQDFDGQSAQDNCRNRVAAVVAVQQLARHNNAYTLYDFASHFSYDALGNVKTLVQEQPRLDYLNQRFKRIDYDFDLHSGKVNMLSYNRGYVDQFYQKYNYDADNRIKTVFTSNDGVNWDRDAAYEYYKHGPLASMQVGEHNVQSVQYAYTIQGWLKAINGDVLNPTADMGQDGVNGSASAPDVFAHALDYFTNDYNPIGNRAVMSSTNNAPLTKNLYNGNIIRQTTALKDQDNLQRNYAYDQLNRLVRTSYQKVDNNSFSVTPVTNDAYANNYSYDADGNILSLMRKNENGVIMDNFTYHYPSSLNNKLNYVTDAAANITNNSVQDLQSGQQIDNYEYDKIGNLVKDKQGGLATIKWNNFGKVEYIYDSVERKTIAFYYDAMGQRIRKDVVYQDANNNGIMHTDMYVRDAQGNVLAVYKNDRKIDNSNLIEWINNDIIENHTPWQEGIVERGLSLFLAENERISNDPIFRVELLNQLISEEPNWVNEVTQSVNSYNVLRYSGMAQQLLVGQSSFNTAVFDYFEQQGEDMAMYLAQGSSIAAKIELLQPIFDQGPNYTDNGEYVGATSDAFDQYLNILKEDFNEEEKLKFIQIKLNHEYIEGSSNEDVYHLIRDYTEQNGTKLFVNNVLSPYMDHFEMHHHFEALMNNGIVSSDYFQNHPTAIKALSIELLNDQTHHLEQFANWFDEHYPDIKEQIPVTLRLEGVYAADKYNFLGQVITGMNRVDIINNALTKKYQSNSVLTATTDDGTVIGGIVVSDGNLISTIRWSEYFEQVRYSVRSNGNLNPTYTPPTISLPNVNNLLGDTMRLAEHHIYGSSRLGIKTYDPSYAFSQYVASAKLVNTGLSVRKPWYDYGFEDYVKVGSTHLFNGNSVQLLSDTFRFKHSLGYKHYEFTDHLGNVIATISDKKLGIGNNNGKFTGWTADVLSLTDYYPFGMHMPAKQFNAGGYRFGFNGQERTDEVYGVGNLNTALFWEYDTRLGRRWNVDPKPNMTISSYATFANNPVLYTDVLGDTIFISKPIFNMTMTALKVLNEGELGKTLLQFYLQSMSENIYLFAYDELNSDKSGSFANTAKENINAKYDNNNRLKLNPKFKGMQEYAQYSGFNFNTKAKRHLVGFNFTNDKHTRLDKYDRAFILYHEIKSHVKDASGNGKKDHEIFGNSGITPGMVLFDNLGEIVVKPNTESWKIFKQILEIKIKDNNGTKQNISDFKYMTDYEKDQQDIKKK